MNRGLWIARKNYLFCLIKKVSDHHGGDTREDLTLHCNQILDLHPDELIENAIECYRQCVEQLKL